MSILESILLVFTLVQSAVLVLKPWSRLHSRIDVLADRIESLDKSLIRQQSRIDAWEDKTLGGR